MPGGAFPPLPAAARRTRKGRTGGLLVLACVLAGGLAHPAPDPADAGPWPVVLALLGALGGLACLLAPWPRVSGAWLHLIPLGASALTAATVAVHGSHGAVYSPLLVLVAAYAAHAFRARGAVAFHVAVAAGALAAPLGGLGAAAAAQLVVLGVVLAGVAGLMVVLRERMAAVQAALREQAHTDPLTGVGNFRRLQARLTYEIARHQRSGRPLALLVLDLDGFKAVNDRYGHPAGDQLLRQVAQRLQQTVRSQDTVTRQGGDEFAVLAPETGEQAAGVLAARIERALAGAGADGTVGVGASVGWAIHPADGAPRTTLIEAADARQRAAKRARRATGRAPVRLSA